MRKLYFWCVILIFVYNQTTLAQVANVQPAVVCVQTQLNKLGFFHNQIDGIFNLATLRASEKYLKGLSDNEAQGFVVPISAQHAQNWCEQIAELNPELGVLVPNYANNLAEVSQSR